MVGCMAKRRLRNVLVFVLAGGEGKRLLPLTADRAKPAVPFGGQYRLIDIVLSNIINAGFLRVAVLTQYKSHSLDRHITTTWRLTAMLNNYVTPVPAQQRLGPRWFLGSADALLQNLNLISDERPDYVIVFGADHVYRMDVTQMLDHHIETGAGLSVAGIRVPKAESDQFGVIDTAPDGVRIERFLEKPKECEGLPDSPDEIFASMGNYIFTTEALVDALTADAERFDSNHDMGGDIVPAMVEQGDAIVYDFTQNEVPGETEADHAYWRDVGTIRAYYDAQMDLCEVVPQFNLYNTQWPLLTYMPPLPPAKFVHEEGERVGRALNSIVSAGAIISGGTARHSVLSPGVRLRSGSLVEGSVLLNNVHIGPSAVVRNAILDKNVKVPENCKIGVDPAEDERRFGTKPGDIVVIEKNAVIKP